MHSPGPGMPPPGPGMYQPAGGPGVTPLGPGYAPPLAGLVPPPPGHAPPPPGHVPPHPGMMQPPVPGGPGMMRPPPPGGPGMHLQPPGSYQHAPASPSGGAGALTQQFEAISLGGPGHPGSSGGGGPDPATLPRPTRPHATAAPAAAHPANCSPANMRLTVNAIPVNSALRARWALPLGVVVRPMANEAAGIEVPLVGLGPSGIVRCRRCRTYINPFVQWTDAGRRFRCNVCAQLNDVPPDYFSNLDNSGRRLDVAEHPELSVGTVEYIAPAEYMVRPPMPPVYFFMIDVTHAAVASGAVAAAAAAIKASLDGLPGDERTRIGIISFDSSIHFYNLRASSTTAQMLVVTEVDEPFVPLPDDLLVPLRECRAFIDAALDTLPAAFAGSTCVESCTGPALQAAFMTMCNLGGKVLLFQTSPPSLGIGKIKARDNPSAYCTDKEPLLRRPDDDFYRRFAGECSRNQISVDVWALGGQYVDVASLSGIPQLTCGDVHYHPGFSARRDGARLHAEVVHNLLRPTAWEAVMRVRCSKGLRTSSFHGHFSTRSSDLLALPTCDPDKAYAVQISHEDQLLHGSSAYVQCALLYTNSNGERRIRVHTLAVPVVSDVSDLFAAADGPALIALSAKLAVERCMTSPLEATRRSLLDGLTSLLREFRLSSGAVSRGAGNALALPPALRLLPLWTMGLQRCAALRGGPKDITSDARSAALHWAMSAPTDALCRAAYPDVYAVWDDPAVGPWGEKDASQFGVKLPPTAPACLGLLNERGAYLFDDGGCSPLLLWVGRGCPTGWAQQVLGAGAGGTRELSSVDPLQLGCLVEPARAGSVLSTRVNAVIAALRRGRPGAQSLLVAIQGSPGEAAAAPYLVEDRQAGGAPSYPEFVAQLHRMVMANN
ncbi:hypothetical protein FOA52_007908 [Chlamydomonas sp. UWO 241]|nr:hypothetical protein FOA52_007908 [Chlamydomonas sp. UWO 241]